MTRSKPAATRPAAGILALLVLLSLLACGCSPSPAAETVVLQVVMADDWADTAPVLSVVRQFESDHPGTRVNLISRPFSQIDDEVIAAMASGRPLDVIHGHAFAAGAAGTAEPLAPPQGWDADYFPGAVEDVMWGDTVYGVPLDINAMFLVLDADLAADGPPPASFQDLRRLAEQAARDGRRGISLSSSSWLAYGWMKANGGEIVEIDGDGRATFTLDRPENVQALQFLADLISDGLAFGPTARNDDRDDYALFSSGDTALLTTGTWDTTRLASDVPDRSFTTAPLPGGLSGSTAGSALGGSSLMVGRGSQHMALALSFIDALTADDVALRLAAEEGRLPPRPSLMGDVGLDTGVLHTLTHQLASAEPQRLIAFPEAQTAFAQAIDDALTGRLPPAEALGRAQQRATAPEVSNGPAQPTATAQPRDGRS